MVRRGACGFRMQAQARPDGLAQAFLIGEDFLAGEGAALVLGDNIFYGQGLPETLQQAAAMRRARRCSPTGCAIRRTSASSSSTSRGGQSVSRRSRPSRSRTTPLTGLYFYDADVSRLAKNAAAVAARRTGDHRPQSPVPRASGAARRAARPRHGVARHGHARCAAPGRQLRPDAAVAAGPADCLSRGDRLPTGVDLARAAVDAWPANSARPPTGSTCSTLRTRVTADERSRSPRRSWMASWLIEPKVFGDSRGFFFEAWHAERYAAAGLPARFVQDNVSRSARGVLRGLHLQQPYPQGKLVQVLEGEIFDVAVDVRLGSPTFGRWVAARFSADNKRQMYVPPGFAHGFCVVSEFGPGQLQVHRVLPPGDRAEHPVERSGDRHRWPIARAVAVGQGRVAQCAGPDRPCAASALADRVLIRA